MTKTYMPKLVLNHDELLAVALYVMTSQAAIQCERLSGGQLRITIDQNDVTLLKERTTPSYVYVQEGGSASELYLHEYETKADAMAGRVECASAGAYKTGGIVEISPCLRLLGNVFFATAEALVGTVPGLALYVDEEVGGI
ncbi:hypothetical protein NHH88_00050 [Oxalobacteraceae bacterium OTU3CAMAD1]|nr:hypothetical protein NHH88_00050 [Oxalobacteraceae bacterium OTU3CAMAD1]